MALKKSPCRSGLLIAYVKLEWLKQRTGHNHFAMKAKIYLAAQKAAYFELKKLSTPNAA